MSLEMALMTMAFLFTSYFSAISVRAFKMSSSICSRRFFSLNDLPHILEFVECQGSFPTESV